MDLHHRKVVAQLDSRVMEDFTLIFSLKRALVTSILVLFHTTISLSFIFFTSWPGAGQ